MMRFICKLHYFLGVAVVFCCAIFLGAYLGVGDRMQGLFNRLVSWVERLEVLK